MTSYHDSWVVLLLMQEIRRSPPGMVLKPCNEMGIKTTFPSTGAKPPDFETMNSMKDKSDAILKACTFWFGKLRSSSAEMCRIDRPNAKEQYLPLRETNGWGWNLKNYSEMKEEHHLKQIDIL